MTNKDLKDFCEAIHTDLKVNNKNGCFIVNEEGKESAIKKIHFTFKNKEDAFIIRQKNNHTINVLSNFSTNRSCDFIVFLIKNKHIKIYFCEIKSSYSEKNIKEAYKQIQASKLFIKYILECYAYYHKKKEFAEIDVDSISKYYYIYPKLGISNKTKTNKSNTEDIQLIPKNIEIYNNEFKISNSYEFFND